MTLIKVRFGLSASLATVALAGLLFAGGCGGSHAAPTPSSGPAGPAAQPSGSAPSASAVSVTIPMGAMGKGAAAFGQNPLTIPVGTTVTWTNEDTIAHTVTAQDGSYDSGPLQPSQTFSHTFGTAGTSVYYCTIHGFTSMNGSVIAK